MFFFLNRSSHTSYYSVTAFPGQCGLFHTHPFAEVCQDTVWKELDESRWGKMPHQVAVK